MTSPAIFAVDTAKDIKALTAALNGATAVVMRCPGERFKAVATAVAKGVFPSVVDLEVVISDFDPGEEVGTPALTAKASAALWHALPALKRLRLRGHALCRNIDHDVLEVLEVEGYAFGGGDVPAVGACPKLRTIRWAFSGDDHGAALEPQAIEPLWKRTQTLPALEHLDLCDADIDGSLLDVASFLKAPLVKQLTTLGVPSSTTPRWQELLTALPNVKSLRVRDSALSGLDARIVVVEPAAADDSNDSDSGDVSDTIDLYGLDDTKLAKQKLLARTQPLRTLTLRWHWLKTEGATIVGQLAAAHPELETLNLNNPATGGWDAAALAAFVDRIDVHPGLKALHLRNNDLAGAGATIVALLAKLPNLEVLELSQTRLIAADLAVVVPAMSRLKKLRVLQLGGVDGKSSTIIRLTAVEAAALPQGVHVTTPSPELTNLINKAADELRAAVDLYQTLSSPTLQQLELWSIGFKEHWPLVFAQLGTRLPALQTLGLDGCRLSTAAVTALVTGLGKHEQLRSLDIQMAPTTAAYEALGTLLSSVSVTHLHLEEVESAAADDEPCESAAIGALARSRSLTHLTININKADTAKYRALAEAIVKLPTLQGLSGWAPKEKDEAICEEFVSMLASSSVRSFKAMWVVTTDALLERDAIETLWIDTSNHFEAVLDYIEAAVKKTSALRELVLHKGELTKERAKLVGELVAANTSITAVTIAMAMKATVAKDIIKRVSKAGRVQTISLAVSAAFEVSIAERQALAAAAHKGTRVVFLEGFSEERFGG